MSLAPYYSRSTLPADVLSLIPQWLDIRSALTARFVSREWSRFCLPVIWRDTTWPQLLGVCMGGERSSGLDESVGQFHESALSLSDSSWERFLLWSSYVEALTLTRTGVVVFFPSEFFLAALGSRIRSYNQQPRRLFPNLISLRHVQVYGINREGYSLGSNPSSLDRCAVRLMLLLLSPSLSELSVYCCEAAPNPELLVRCCPSLQSLRLICNEAHNSKRSFDVIVDPLAATTAPAAHPRIWARNMINCLQDFQQLRTLVVSVYMLQSSHSIETVSQLGLENLTIVGYTDRSWRGLELPPLGFARLVTFNAVHCLFGHVAPLVNETALATGLSSITLEFADNVCMNFDEPSELGECLRGLEASQDSLQTVRVLRLFSRGSHTLPSLYLEPEDEDVIDILRDSPRLHTLCMPFVRFPDPAVTWFARVPWFSLATLDLRLIDWPPLALPALISALPNILHLTLGVSESRSMIQDLPCDGDPATKGRPGVLAHLLLSLNPNTSVEDSCDRLKRFLETMWHDPEVKFFRG